MDTNHLSRPEWGPRPDRSGAPLPFRQGLHWAILVTGLGVVPIAADHLPLQPVPERGALRFDAGDERVQAPNSNGVFDLTDSITIEAWVNVTYPKQKADWTPMIAKETDWGIFVREVSAGQQISFTTGTSDADLLIYDQLPEGEWHHVAAVYDGSEKRLYVDGDLVTNMVYTVALGTAVAASDLVFGDRDDDSVEFTGGLDAVRIWSEGRTQAKIRADLDRDLLPLQPGLLGEWRFDEGTGTEVTDSSGNERHGEVFGTGVWVNGLGFRTAPPVVEVPTHAVRFGGAGRFAEVAHEPDFDLAGPLTLEAWVNVDGFGHEIQSIVTKGNAWGILVQRTNDLAHTGHLVFRTGHGGTSEDLMGPTELLPGRWYHVAAVHDGSEKSLYLDGHLEAGPVAAGSIVPDDLPVLLAGNAEALEEWLSGTLDTVRIWRVARSEAELLADRFNTFQRLEPDLVGEWRFDEVAGQTAYDSSLGDARRRHASLVNLGDLDRVAGLALETLYPEPTSTPPTGAVSFAGGIPDLSLQLGAEDEESFSELAALTLETWVNLQALQPGESQAVITKGNAWALALEPTTTTDPPDSARLVLYSFENGVLHARKSLALLGLNEWHHLAGVFDGAAGEKRLYIDGLLDPGVSDPPSFSGRLGESEARLKLGSVDDNAAPLGSILEPFEGFLDEVRIWQSARSAEEILDAMDHQLRGTETGLFGVWRFDSDQVAATDDSSFWRRHLGGAVAPTDQVDGLGFVPPADGSLALAFYNPFGLPGVQYVELPSGQESEFDFSEAMTVETWVFVRSFPGDRAALVSKGNWSLALTDSGKIVFTTVGITDATGDNPTEEFFSFQSLQAGSWYHVAATFGESTDPNAPGKMKGIAINGADDRVEAGFTGAITLNNLSVLFGAAPPASNPADRFDGVLDEIRIWDQQRSPSEIRSAFNRRLNGDEPGLAGFWSLNEGHGNAAREGTGASELEGALQGTMTRLNRVDGVVFRDPPSPQYALGFDGSGQDVEVGHDPVLDLGPSMTLEAWIRPEARDPNDPTWRTILSKGTGGYGFGLDQNDFLRYFTDETTQNSLSASSELENGVWHHVAVVVDGDLGTTTFFLNGRRNASYPSAAIGNNSESLFLGSRGNREYFLGDLDKVRIWDHARRDLEIELMAFTAVTPGSPGLVGYWTFNQGSGTTLADLSGNDLAGQLRPLPPTSLPSWTSGNIWGPPPQLTGLDLAANPDAAGLWIGQVVLHQVNEVQSAVGGAAETPTPTGDTASIRILLHVDARGEVRLLKDVIVMKRRSSSDPAASAPVEESNLVLVTDPSRIPEFDGVSLRKGKRVGLRYGAAAYDFDGFDLPLLGGLAPGGGCLGKILLPADHPTNPFRHKFHPDHRNGFDLVRQLTLQFDADPGDPALIEPGYGVDRLTGVYREVVTGLHKIPIVVEGNLALRRISTVPVLNDQP